MRAAKKEKGTMAMAPKVSLGKVAKEEMEPVKAKVAKVKKQLLMNEDFWRKR